MENLDQTAALMKPVINPDRRMQDFTNVRAFGNWRSDMRKALQELDMLEKGETERFRRDLIVSANIVEDAL